MKARLLGLLIIAIALLLGFYVGYKSVKPQVKTVYYTITPSPVLVSPTASPSGKVSPAKRLVPSLRISPTVPFTKTPTQ